MICCANDAKDEAKKAKENGVEEDIYLEVWDYLNNHGYQIADAVKDPQEEHDLDYQLKNDHSH